MEHDPRSSDKVDPGSKRRQHHIKWPNFLSPTLGRIFVLLILSVILIIVGFNYLYSPEMSSVSNLPGNPVIQIVGNSRDITAVLTRVELSTSALNFNLRFVVPPKIREGQLAVILGNLRLGRSAHSGWVSGRRVTEFYWGAVKALKIPVGISNREFHLSLVDCGCYNYSAPYLTVTGLQIFPPLSTGHVVAPGQADIPGTYLPKGSYSITPVIEQEWFNFSGPRDPGGGAFASMSTYLPVQQTGPAEWLWQNVSWRTPYYAVVAESVSGKAHEDNRTFIAGLFLGIGGSGIIVVVDRLFDIWADYRREGNGSSSKPSKELSGTKDL